MKWFFKCLRQYADFNGRARRTEYWMFVLFQFIFLFIAVILDMGIGTPTVFLGHQLFTFLVLCATVIPIYAVSARRLHDTGKSGWLLLLLFIPWLLWLFLSYKMADYTTNNIFYPYSSDYYSSDYQTMNQWKRVMNIWLFIGGIVLIILACIDSQPGTNEWGENPKEIGNNVSAGNLNVDWETQLKTLNELKTKGVITEEMYQQESKKILDEQGNILLSTTANQPNNNLDLTAQLKTLNELRAKSVITEEIYQQESKKILEKI